MEIMNIYIIHKLCNFFKKEKKFCTINVHFACFFI